MSRDYLSFLKVENLYPKKKLAFDIQYLDNHEIRDSYYDYSRGAEKNKEVKRLHKLDERDSFCPIKGCSKIRLDLLNLIKAIWKIIN